MCTEPLSSAYARPHREIASAHLAEVRTKLVDLARLEKILADTISRCSGDQSPACPVSDMLDAVP
jgi:MerR family mercuric resistance operon transcriptional regulator